MRYGSDFLKETNALLKTIPNDFMDGWSFEFEGGLNDVSVEDACRALDEAGLWGGMPYDRKLWLAKLSVIGKKGAAFYNEKQVGPGFILTKSDQSFDLFPEIHDNPPALRKLLEVCVSAIVRKCAPPLTDGRPPAAGTRGPGTSSARQVP